MASNEGKALDHVVRLLERRDGKNRTDVRRPEKDLCGPPVDLRLRLGSREYAFEHTQIEPFERQIYQDHKFASLVKPVEDALSGTLPGRAKYYLDFPSDTDLGVDRRKLGEIRNDLIAWVREKAQCLHERAIERSLQGLPADRLDPIQAEPPRFPFEVALSRKAHSSLSQSSCGVLTVGRVQPENLEQLRCEALRESLNRKCPKLQLCKEEGARTVLVLEAEDILTDSGPVAEQLAPLLKDRTDSPDEIFVVETSSDEWEVWPMKCDDQLWSAWICLPLGALVHIDDLTDLTTGPPY